ILDIAVNPDAAPLPGKIVKEEAKGYAAFAAKSVIENHKMEKMPPMKDVVRHFF
ncbi:MAG: hypothetical protein ABF586_12700, partial [Sporolactobacillus sp.]